MLYEMSTKQSTDRPYVDAVCSHDLSDCFFLSSFRSFVCFDSYSFVRSFIPSFFLNACFGFVGDFFLLK